MNEDARVTAHADQQAAASREASGMLSATHNGQEVALRTVTVEVTPGEAEALARGEVPPDVQAQLDCQGTEDEVIAVIEQDWEGAVDPVLGDIDICPDREESSA